MNGNYTRTDSGRFHICQGTCQSSFLSGSPPESCSGHQTGSATFQCHQRVSTHYWPCEIVPSTLTPFFQALTLNRSEKKASQAGGWGRQPEIFRLLLPKALTFKAVWSLGYYSAVDIFDSELRLFGVVKGELFKII